LLLIGAAPLSVDDVRAVARDGVSCRLSDAAAARIGAAHAATLALLGAGVPIYGVTTGLGAAVDTTLPAADPEYQRRIPLARTAGVGSRLPRETVRAMMLARLSRLACGASGISLPMAEALATMLDRGVTPAVPAIGSIGEADLVPLAHIAAILSGGGTADFRGAQLDAPDALARAGITVPPFGPKDGLALVSSNAGSVGPAALLAADAARALNAALNAAALSLEGFRGSLTPFEPRAVVLRPTQGQAETAAALLALLAGGDLMRPTAARRLQDPLSFRVIASVQAAATGALINATALIELELNSSDDNPAIISDPAQALPTANFDATALALALETLGQALLRVASAAAGRVLRLMSPATNDLPRFLAAPGQNGFATVQKTLAALLGTLQHDAAPLPVCVLPVADSVEDYASMAAPIVDKTARVLTNFRYVVAIELMVAAQACDLRRPIRLGTGTARLHALIRTAIPALTQDRSTGPDIECLAALIADGTLA
jgi:histidine ammonia-lyase